MSRLSSKEKVDRLKLQIDPNAFYEEEQGFLGKGPKMGWRNAGLCPFHKDRHSGSFYIHTMSGGYNCFSCGNHGGDIIDFTMKRHGLAFPQAIEKLAQDWEVIL
jgi:DNA primase